MGNHWYEVSYQWPWNDREIIKIPVKVVQDGRDFKIINIISHGEYLLPEKQ